MLIGTVFGVFVIPILFIVFQALQERLFGVKEPSHTPRILEDEH